MKTLEIKQKMSITGSIHDLASQDFDRQIKFRAGTLFAVVESSYYGGNGYTTHKTEEATAVASHRNSSSHQIIDFNGVVFTACGARLVATGQLDEPFELT